VTEYERDIWNVKYKKTVKAVSQMRIRTELPKYKLELVGVQEVRWNGSGTDLAGEYTFFSGKGNDKHEFGTEFFVQNIIISILKWLECVSDRQSYITQVAGFI
jgi:hypothetical protein